MSIKNFVKWWMSPVWEIRPSDAELARVQSIVDKLPDGSLKVDFSMFEKPASAKTFEVTDIDHYEFHKIRVEVKTDGTRTEVLLHQKGMEDERKLLGYGLARRRKGDARNSAVGEALALARAFQSVADMYQAEAEAVLG